MSGVRIEIDDATVKAGLGRLAALGQDLRPILQAIGARLVANTLARFEQGRDPFGLPWKTSRRAERQHGQTLIDSGRLRTSITFRLPSPTSLEVGTNVKYAATHQFGATIRARTKKGLRFKIPGVGWRTAREVTIPPRPFLGFGPDDFDDVSDILARHLRAALDGSSGPLRGGRPAT